ncbi:unnamed protein product [Bursaphelenchus xylophilus]|uniref:(pine wood nematode) hypothetical protein n=1 Tax=Bursaphelenchus xylophilus TaxID=6326 RepID=A0A1I7RXG0_BURXY|nr:unnamed protein product [Bursaphelenchus xylophilus]CAG9126381.1 unnamed protein product [Bursaphelenchus xylophilus]
MEVQTVALNAVERYNKNTHPKRVDILLEILEAQSREATLGDEYIISLVIGVTGCSFEHKNNCTRKDVEFVDFVNVDALKTISMKEYVFTFHKMK